MNKNYKLKILHVTPSYYPATYWGGPIFSVLHLNNALSEDSNIKLKVLTTDTAGEKISNRLSKKDTQNLFPNYEVIFCRRILGASISIELLKKLIRLTNWADIVHLTSTYSFPIIPTLILCRYYNKKIVWSPRGAIMDANDWKKSRKRFIKRIWEKTCNLIIKKDSIIFHVTSENEYKTSLSRMPKITKAKIIYNGITIPSTFIKRNWMSNGILQLIFLGRISPKKGIENLLKAMKILENDKTIFLTIYGSGDVAYTTKIISLAKNLNLVDRSVSFAGQVDGNDKHNAFLNADVCIVPSYTENFCNVVVEALAYGVPTITSHGTPWAKIIDKNCGLWINNSPESLAQAIKDIQKKDLGALGECGRQWMQDEFSWDIIAKQMYELYYTELNKDIIKNG